MRVSPLQQIGLKGFLSGSIVMMCAEVLKRVLSSGGGIYIKRVLT